MFSFFRRTTKNLLSSSNGSGTGSTSKFEQVVGHGEQIGDKSLNEVEIENVTKNDEPTLGPTHSSSSSKKQCSSSIVVQLRDINSNVETEANTIENIKTKTKSNSLRDIVVMAPTVAKKSQKRNKTKQNKHQATNVAEHKNKHVTSTAPVTSTSTPITTCTPMMARKSDQQKIVHTVKPNVHFSDGTRDDKATMVRSVSMSTTQLNDKTWDCDNDKKLVINQEIKINELLKMIADKELKINHLQTEIDHLKSQVDVKNTSIDCLKTELKLSEDMLKQLKTNINDLNKSFVNKTSENTNLQLKIKELENLQNELNSNISNLENELNQIRDAKQSLELDKLNWGKNQLEERDLMSKNLEDVIRQKSERDQQWEIDFEKMRTVNMAREQQMFEDFEWKLREVEKMCRKKLDDKESEFVEKMDLYEKEVLEKFQGAERELNDLKRYKSYEAEVKQLRGLTNDQQNSLTIMSKQLSDYQTNERILQDDICKMKGCLAAEIDRFQIERDKLNQLLANREKELFADFEKDKSALAIEWEKRLHDECNRLKSELEQIHNEGQTVAILSIRNEHKLQIDELNLKWNDKLNESLNKFENLTETLSKKELFYKEEIRNLQTTKDSETLELRRAIDKIDFSYSDKIDKLIDKYSSESNQLIVKHTKEIDDLKRNFDKQLENLTTNFDLVKDQIHAEYEDKIEHIKSLHQEELGRQWEKLLEEKDNFSAFIEDEYSEQLNQLKDELITVKKCFQLKESELLDLVDELTNQAKSKDVLIQSLQSQQGHSNDSDYINSNFEYILSEQKQQLIDLEDQHIEQMALVQNQNQSIVEQLQQKCQCLTKLLETTKSRYEKRESRSEDRKLISDLKKIISEQENDISILNEEKRFYQMQVHRQRDENGTDDVIGTKGIEICKSKSMNDIGELKNESQKSLSCPT